ncbi:ATP-binding protein [Streptomyces sp. AN091965]|uniref:ATP-binding protein n=1 Tax=Streptomyces sp. AN091965 TaxID=2927803 RepID=UPI001F6197B4|nr:ATP-binding protein [Streptomyces sp. AN091965]MCI3928132.1 ATP-binding protein [Streptomyces sp. AN091965]
MLCNRADEGQHAGRLEGRLQAARQRTFVGRKEELAAFEEALCTGARVLFVHGSGGVGKSALLGRFAQRAAEADRNVLMLDGRVLKESPAAFVAEAGAVLADDRAVLLIDAFERMQGLESWLREQFLPVLPTGALVVIAGRIPPGVMWQVDPGWADMVRIIELGELGRGDAAALLGSRGVAGELYEPLLTFASGHPLALSLGATAAGEGAAISTAVAVRDSTVCSRWRPPHDVVAALLDQIVGQVPSPAHRHALEVCAHTYMSTQDVLRAALPGEDAATLFSWLRRLPFVEAGPYGLYPHDVVREILEADLRWRDPQGYADMHRCIRACLTERIRAAEDSDVLGAVGSLFYLHRGDDRRAAPHVWRGAGEVYEDVFRPEDAEDLLGLATEQDSGTVAVVSHWMARQPQAFRLYRRAADGELAGASAWLRLETEAQAQADPVAATAWATARANAPLRPGEHLAVYRSWVRECHRGFSPMMNLIQWRAVAWFLRSPHLAWSFVAMRGGDRSSGPYQYYDMHDLGAHAQEGDAEYVLTAHDWRAVPARVWLDRLLATGAQEVPATHEPKLVVLSQEEFRDAVRHALRHLPVHGELAANPLTRTRLLAGRAAPARALRELLEDSIRDLGRDPWAGKPHRALDVTFLRGAPTHEAAAERLGLSLSTYRRHLNAGIERISDDLWRRELCA